ncbi:MAG TPA: thioredoxin family protein [Burkholderiaceae bacterium]|nr:thioredoxin family protein [Burkholderiaceae bacterium]
MQMLRLISSLIGVWFAVCTAAAAQGLPRFGAPEPHVKAELIAATDAAVPGQPLQVGLRLVHDPEWHTYWQVPGDSGLPTRINWALPTGVVAGPIEWPHPHRLPAGPLVNFGYEGDTLLLTTLKLPADLAHGTVTLDAKTEWLECRDVCIPGSADLKLTLPVKAQAAPSSHAARFAEARKLVPEPVDGLAARGTTEANRIRIALDLPAGRKADRIEFFPLQEGRIEPAAAQVLDAANGTALVLTAAQPVKADAKALAGVIVANGGPAKPGGWTALVDAPLVAGTVPLPVTGAPAGAVASGPTMTLLAALGAAFVGGLILNLMPCVFPVLSLKLIGLAQHRTHSGPMAAHGAAFAVGVVLSFVLLAGLLIALQKAGSALGWGFQLQTPWVVASLTLLFFVIGLNLLGVYEFTFGSGLGNTRAADALVGKSDWRGSFGTGVLAVIVASPCTAPFMSAALGYAITQPAALALSVFAMLGVGMATPYLLLTLFPALLSKLPRPGRWMELFKQFMAFPMFATCVWLLWVLAQQVDAGGVALALGVLVAAGFTLWSLGLAQRGASRFRWVALAGAVLAAVTFMPIATSDPGSGSKTAGGAGWVEYSPEKLAQLTADGKPVFVDFTAAWCVTCQVNKRVALNTDKVINRFAAEGIVRMKADWTNRNERITQALAQFGRNGVPLYVLYDTSGKPTVLPEILTEGTVLAALDKVKLASR